MTKKISPKKYAALLYELTVGKKPPAFEIIVKKLLNLLKKNNQFKLCPQIIAEFEKLWNAQKGIAKINFVTARKIDGDSLSKIMKELENKLDKNIEITADVNPDLIGGVILRYDDKLIDGSVKKQLARIAAKTRA